MILFTLAFLLGDICLQQFPSLPSLSYTFILLTVILACWILLRCYSQYAYLLLALTLGFAWSAWYASDLISWTLPKEIEGKPTLITGYITSLPTTDKFSTHTEFALPNNVLIRLSWGDAPQSIRVGDKWQLMARLKRIHGTQNPGAFDFEAWALQKKLRATGYVVASDQNKLIAHDWHRYPINQLRQKLQHHIQAQLPHTSTSPWLMALILGERNGIAQQDWQVLRNTGTNHLMAIAGLHIGLIAGFVHSFTAWIWRRMPYLVLRMPAMEAGAIAALIAGVSYSALAGFSIPTQRACIMLTFFILAILSRRKINAWHPWSLALFIVLLINPLSVLTDSFYLSFTTIALIIYGMRGRLNPSGFWWKWGRVQWVIGVGLIPVSFALFRETSLVSFAANCIAIPWMGFFILPFCFLSCIVISVTPSVAGVLLYLADKSLALLWIFLSWLSHYHFSVWQQTIPNHGILILTLIGFILLLMPAGMPGRWLGIAWIMPLIFYVPSRPAIGDIWLTLLDVGQGLSVVVQTTHHTLLYDAGPKYDTHSDMGESVVLPYLSSISVNQIDKLIVSHGDLDHIGGTQAVLNALPVATILTSVPEKFPSSSAQYCLDGQTWQWDNIRFRMIYPTNDDLHLKNDSSCVLRIDNGKQSILLTGDIEKYAEKDLLDRASTLLSANIIIAPHHGSKTSGLVSFISTVHPQYVLYATGYRNRYHFPHASVMHAYQNINATQLNTANTGAIHFKLQSNQSAFQPQLYRTINKHYWYA